VTVSPERPSAAGARYRVDARRLPFTPSWFWEVIDVAQNRVVENSLALSRAVYPSPADALEAGRDYVLAGAAPLLDRRAA
jgi:hypothetical protein